MIEVSGLRVDIRPDGVAVVQATTLPPISFSAMRPYDASIQSKQS